MDVGDPELNAARLEHMKSLSEGETFLGKALRALGMGRRRAIAALKEGPEASLEKFLEAIKSGDLEQAIVIERNAGKFFREDKEGPFKKRLEEGLMAILRPFAESQRGDKKEAESELQKKLKIFKKLSQKIEKPDFTSILKSVVDLCLSKGRVLGAATVMVCGMAELDCFDIDERDAKTVCNYLEEEYEKGNMKNLEVFRGIKLINIFLWYPKVKKEIERRLSSYLEEGELLKAARLIKLTNGYQHPKIMTELKKRLAEEEKKDSANLTRIDLDRAFENYRSINLQAIIQQKQAKLARSLSGVDFSENPGEKAEILAAFGPYIDLQFTQDAIERNQYEIKDWFWRQMYDLRSHLHTSKSSASEKERKECGTQAHVIQREITSAFMAYGPYIDLSKVLKKPNTDIGLQWSFEPYASVFKEKEKEYEEAKAREWLKRYFLNELKDTRLPGVEPFLHISGE